MCLTRVEALGARQWNWDGDFIVHRCIVPSSRPVIGYAKRNYDIDVREFLVTTRNEVIDRTLETDVRRFVISKDSETAWKRFLSRERGAFDYKATTLLNYVSSAIRYEDGHGKDPWQFPDETLSIKCGDCEDRALLLASLLLASGVSSYNVRVALGRISLWNSEGRTVTGDHAWVMYKNEVGRWLILEPKAKRIRTRKEYSTSHAQFTPIAAKYTPSYVFNDSHLWQMFHAQSTKLLTEVKLKQDWSQIHPSFTGRVHKSILERALTSDICPIPLKERLVAFSYFGMVDPIDDGSYDPIDHFDNNLIEEGWEKVAARLSMFNKEGQSEKGIEAFAYAAHAIADFYAHSSYVHFSKSDTPCDPARKDLGLSQQPIYSEGEFDLTSDKFTTNSFLWKGTRIEAAARLATQIISGRYAQPGDNVRGDYEGKAGVVKDLKPIQGAVPHHEEIAVDGNNFFNDGGTIPGKHHKLYKSESEYWKQFALRKGAAINHIKKAFQESFAG